MASAYTLIFSSTPLCLPPKAQTAVIAPAQVQSQAHCMKTLSALAGMAGRGRVRAVLQPVAVEGSQDSQDPGATFTGSQTTYNGCACWQVFTCVSSVQYSDMHRIPGIAWIEGDVLAGTSGILLRRGMLSLFSAAAGTEAGRCSCCSCWSCQALRSCSQLGCRVPAGGSCIHQMSWPSCVAEHQPGRARSLSLQLSRDVSAPLQCTCWCLVDAPPAAGQHEFSCMHGSAVPQAMHVGRGTAG